MVVSDGHATDVEQPTFNISMFLEIKSGRRLKKYRIWRKNVDFGLNFVEKKYFFLELSSEKAWICLSLQPKSVRAVCKTRMRTGSGLYTSGVHSWSPADDKVEPLLYEMDQASDPHVRSVMPGFLWCKAGQVQSVQTAPA